MRWFGSEGSWAPATDDPAEQIPVPVGRECGWCSLPMTAESSGFVVPGMLDWTVWHRECWLRSVVGGIAHLDGKCTCQGGSMGPSLTSEQMYEEARQVWDRYARGAM